MSAMPASRARHLEHRGLEGHQWSLHRTSGARLPCRIVCQCGWVSSAGEETYVLLQLKGHLEDRPAAGAELDTRPGDVQLGGEQAIALGKLDAGSGRRGRLCHGRLARSRPSNN
jgi:hypothetical protein